ncbi:MAG: hypothetical protein GWP60_01525 [Gammaproteobacteria bacterium]|nr:hypothetical protein [Gammaproteobacteria bacterium]
MTTAEQRRQWIEALHAYRDDSDRMFALVASLANLLDKELVIETMESVLGVSAVHDGDCIIFDDLAIQFGRDDRVKSVFRTIDGTAGDLGQLD